MRRDTRVVHPYHRARIQIETPLDFLVVSDHGEFMGRLAEATSGAIRSSPTPRLESANRKMAAQGNEIKVFEDLIAQVNGVVPPNPDLNSEEVNRTVWAEIMDAADRHNEPGKFTAFMGWEWTSTPQGANLHRVVVMKGGKENGETFIPYTSLDSDQPEDLWAWLEETTTTADTEFIAIPHNSNISKGLMFPLADSDGKAITEDYAKLRMRWEPIVEVTQIKGDSETHPKLSPTDEFADYETYDHLIEVEGTEERTIFGEGFLGELSEKDRKYVEENLEHVAKVGDYVRPALLRGLVLEDRVGGNPYKFGLIGSTDAHTGMSSAEEDNFHGKMAIDSTPENKSKDVIPGTPGWDMGAAGLAAVWATENTRDALFDAMKRKEECMRRPGHGSSSASSGAMTSSTRMRGRETWLGPAIRKGFRWGPISPRRPRGRLPRSWFGR